MKKYLSFSVVLLIILSVSCSLLASGGAFRVIQKNGVTASFSIIPVQGNQPAKDFYNYDGNSANVTDDWVTKHLQSRRCLIIPYRYEDSLSLIIVFGKVGMSSGGGTSMDISGLPSTAEIVVRDDPDDYRDKFPTLGGQKGSFTWVWDRSATDGIVIKLFNLDKLTQQEQLTISPTRDQKWDINSVMFLGSKKAHKVTNAGEYTFIVSSNTQPTPQFSVEGAERPVVGSTVTFNASKSQDPDGSIKTWAWDFDGDGNFEKSFSTPEVPHVFSNKGTRSVTLKVIDNQGGSSTYSRTIDVRGQLATATRTVSASSALPGRTVRVVVNITAHTTLSGVGLVERIPQGWSISTIANANFAYKSDPDDSVQKWVDLSKLQPGETKKIIYQLNIPKAENMITTSIPQTFSISGTISSVQPSYRGTVAGDTKIRLRDGALKPATTIAHYNINQQAIDLTLNSKISDRQLQWAANRWVTERVVPETGGEILSYADMKRLAAYNQTSTLIDEQLPQPKPTEVTIRRTIYTPLPFNQVLLGYKQNEQGQFKGDYFTVQLTFSSSDRALYGVGFYENIPAAWNLTPIDKAGAVYKASTHQWLFLESVGTSKTTISYRVEVPQSTPTETYTISGWLSEAYSGKRVKIRGDSKIDVTATLPPKVVFAKWDTTTDTLNLKSGNSVTYRQVKEALGYWLEDKEVPYTGGKQISYDTMKEIITHWLEGEPITTEFGDK